MPYSYRIYEADGSIRAFGVPFPYLAQAHVHASINGVEVGTIEWTSPSTINLPSPPADKAVVRVWRQTPLDDLAVRFTSGILATQDLNRLAVVNLYAAQEAFDLSAEARDLAGLTDEAALSAHNEAEHAEAVASSVENWATVVGQAYENTVEARDEAVAAAQDTVRYTPQSRTADEKAHARLNLGLHAVSATGSYADLTGIPDPTPTGEVSLFLLAAAPTGWLELNGAAVSRTTYAGLFAILGTSYGPGNGTTTFNLPDWRGEFFRAWDHGRGVDAGRTLGSFQADAFKSHTHEVGYSTTNTGGGTGGYSPAGPTIASGATGGSETRPRNVALLVCIKT